MWIIGGTDAAAKNFVCTRGARHSAVLHGEFSRSSTASRCIGASGEPGLLEQCGHRMPEKMVGAWLRLDGDTFREARAPCVLLSHSRTLP